jgi:hypothetical protein
MQDFNTVELSELKSVLLVLIYRDVWFITGFIKIMVLILKDT